MTGTVATPLSAFFSPSPPRGTMRSTTPVWVASSASSSRPPPETSATAPAGDARGRRGVGGDRREDRVGVRGARGAAQDDRVAALEAERGGVDRDVRPGLVDDGDDPERHPDLLDVEAVGQPLALDDLPHRIGECRDVAHLLRDDRDPRRGELEAIEERCAETVLAPGLHVARVGLEDLGRAGLEAVRDGQQGRVLDRGRQRGQAPGSGLRGQAGVGDGHGGGGHGAKGTGGRLPVRGSSPTAPTSLGRPPLRVVPGHALGQDPGRHHRRQVPPHPPALPPDPLRRALRRPSRRREDRHRDACRGDPRDPRLAADHRRRRHGGRGRHRPRRPPVGPRRPRSRRSPSPSRMPRSRRRSPTRRPPRRGTRPRPRRRPAPRPRLPRSRPSKPRRRRSGTGTRPSSPASGRSCSAGPRRSASPSSRTAAS